MKINKIFLVLLLTISNVAMASVVATPTIEPNGDTFTSSVKVKLKCSTAGATIRYTTDGSDPTSSSKAYSSPITLTRTATVKAKAFKSGDTPSDTNAAGFIINVATPTIDPNGDTFTSSVKVKLKCSTAGATIRYTTDGSDPTSSSKAYSSPITLTRTATVKAKAFKSGDTPSTTVTATFTASIVGSWHMMEFDTPAQITYHDNGLQGGGDFDVMAGNLTINANGTCSGNMGGDFTGTYSIGSDGIITVRITDSNGTSTHMFYINAGKDTMTTIESDTDHNGQSILIAQRVPSSVSASDIAGSWHMMEFDTPAQITYHDNGLQGGGDFDVMAGNLTINANGTCSGNMGGDFTGTYSIGSDGIITVRITDSNGTSTHMFYINAGKDTMTTIESDTDHNGQSILIAQRVPSSVSP